MTLDELEVLSRAYLDCRLSKIQEKELQLVLESTDMSSPALAEALETMRITSELENLKPQSDTRRKPRQKAWRWYAAAACAAIVISSVVLLNHAGPGKDDDSSCVVYVDGKVLDASEANSFAMNVQSQCMAKMNEALQRAEREQRECMKLINSQIR